MKVPCQIFTFSILIILLTISVRSESKRVCDRTLNYCKNSICQCPEGMKPNKNKTCCVNICDNKCIGGKCVGKNRCKCLPGYTATAVPNVCEPFCSNCTNGYCYGYEMCASRRYSEQQLVTNSPKSTESVQCQFVTSSAVIGADGSSTGSTEVQGQTEFPKRSNTITNNLINVEKTTTTDGPKPMKVASTKSTHFQGETDAPKKNSTITNNLIILQEITTTDGPKPRKVSSVSLKQQAIHEIKTSAPDVQKPSTFISKSNSDLDVIFKGLGASEDDNNHMSALGAYQTITNAHEANEPEEVHVSSVAQPEKLASDTIALKTFTYENKQKLFSNELFLAEISLGVGLLLGIGLFGLLVAFGNRYRKQHQSYTIL